MSEELKEVLDRVQFWGVGRQEEKRDVVGQIEVMGDMPPGAIEDNDGMGAEGDLRADFSEMQGHGFGIGMGENQGRRPVAFGAGRGEQIGSLVALIPRLSWTATPACPLAG